MDPLEHILLEKMHASEHEILRRKELLHLTDADLALLRRCRGIMEEEIDSLIESFYLLQTSLYEVVALIGDAETLRRLHASQRGYVMDLFNGSADLDYVHNRLRIGLVHQRIGVQPKLYLSAVRTLRELIVNVLERRIGDQELLIHTCQALDKLLYFDVSLVFDTYIRSLVHEVETEKGKVENYAASLELLVAERTRELEEKVTQLEAALVTVKRLEGVIPICGICKKIRNDEESWEQLEQYISEHSEAMFSHGLCPDCFEKQMRELRGLPKGGPDGKI